MRLISILSLFSVVALTPYLAQADQAWSSEINNFALLAQNDGDDSYDPFADYSEFEEQSDEEADINFFRNGRFFTLGIGVGYRRFTNVMNEIYSPGTNFGIALTYFFDLRFGLQVGYTAGTHNLEIKTSTRDYRGNIDLTSTSFHLKYFLSAQNVTRGLATVNPYFVGGFSQNYRTFKVSGTEAYSRDGALGFDAGIGMEVPMMRNKIFVGLQALYQIVNFADENTELQFRDSGTNAIVSTNIYPRGDIISATLILGINF